MSTAREEDAEADAEQAGAEVLQTRQHVEVKGEVERHTGGIRQLCEWRGTCRVRLGGGGHWGGEPSQICGWGVFF